MTLYLQSKYLKDFNNIQLINHYLINGIKENREYNLKDNFIPEEYKFLNDDLKHLNNNQLINHYLNYGIRENRNYKFNFPVYFNLNDYCKILLIFLSMASIIYYLYKYY